MVYTIRLTTTNIHLINTSGHPTHCIDCAVQLLRDDLGGDYIGLLKAGDSVSYAAACEEGKPHQLLLKDGYCVVSPPSSLDTDWTTFVDSVLMPRFKICASKGLPLLANSLNKKSIYKNNSERRWANIYPSEYEQKPKVERKQLMVDIERFAMGISKTTFPHDFYCMSAHNAGQHYLGKKDRTITAPLQVKKINGFARGNHLGVRQSLHIDGKELGIAVIFIRKCEDLGYPFHVIPKTHNLMHKHDVCVPLPSGASIRVCLKPPEFLVFAESVIHAGGEASQKYCSAQTKCETKLMRHSEKKSTLTHGWFGSGLEKNKQPTDISFQISFSHRGKDSTLDLGSGRNIWYENDDCDMTEEQNESFQNYVKSGECGFVDAVSDASMSWIKLLKGGSIRRKRDRLCK